MRFGSLTARMQGKSNGRAEHRELRANVMITQKGLAFPVCAPAATDQPAFNSRVIAVKPTCPGAQ